MSTDRFRSLRSRMSEAADAAMIEAADAELRDDPLTDRPVDAAAAAERERSAKAAKLAAQTANAMVAVQGQLKLRGQAADKANTKQLPSVSPIHLRERFLAIPNNSNTHTSFGAWSPVHARARRADRVAR